MSSRLTSTTDILVISSPECTPKSMLGERAGVRWLCRVGRCHATQHAGRGWRVGLCECDNRCSASVPAPTTRNRVYCRTKRIARTRVTRHTDQSSEVEPYHQQATCPQICTPAASQSLVPLEVAHRAPCRNPTWRRLHSAAEKGVRRNFDLGFRDPQEICPRRNRRFLRSPTVIDLLPPPTKTNLISNRAMKTKEKAERVGSRRWQ